MQTVEWNKGWSFSRLSEMDKAVVVDLPHDAMLAEPRGAHCPSGVNKGTITATSSSSPRRKAGWNRMYSGSLRGSTTTRRSS